MFWQRAFEKLAALHCTGHQNSLRLAASRVQILPEWPPVACKFYLRCCLSHATWIQVTVICLGLAATRLQFAVTGGHSGTIWMWLAAVCYFCMQLAATLVQFKCDWPPVACNFWMRLVATQVKFVCDWLQDAHYFSYRLAASRITSHIHKNIK
jgi:hypothetical protein